jgi:hypothetical protein
MSVTAVLVLWCTASLLMAPLLGRAIRTSQRREAGMPKA